MGLPKYRRAWAGLAALGFLGFSLPRFVPEQFQSWCLNLGGIFLVIAMAFLVAGMVAERREADREAKGNGSSNQKVDPIN